MATQRQPQHERRITVLEPERRLSSWFEDMEHFYNRMLRPFGFHPMFRESLGLVGQGLWLPEIDVLEKEKEKEITIRADLPGMKREDIHLAVENEMLVISGSRKEEREEKAEEYFLVERGFGEFRRAIPLPEGVDAEKIAASYKDGVLEVHVPRPASEARRKKEIKVA